MVVPFRSCDLALTGVHSLVMAKPVTEEAKHVGGLMQGACLVLGEVGNGCHGVGLWRRLTDIAKGLQRVGILQKESSRGVAGHLSVTDLNAAALEAGVIYPRDFAPFEPLLLL